MIITREKYKDSYIVYIDESKERYKDMPSSVMLEVFQDYFDSLAEGINGAMCTIEVVNAHRCMKIQP